MNPPSAQSDPWIVSLRFTRFYRDYPRFNHLSDAKCEKLFLQARLKRGDAAWIIPAAAAALLTILPLAFLSIIIHLFLESLAQPATIGGVAGEVQPPAELSALRAVLWVGNIFFSSLIFIALFTLARRMLLVTTMQRLLDKAVCPFCDFSLKGLIARENAVQCPECGSLVVLHEHRLTQDDLLPDTPAGMQRMREHFKSLGADAHGAYANPNDRTRASIANPQPQHQGRWHTIQPKGKPGA